MREHLETEHITSKGSIPSPPREFTSAFKPEFHIASLPGRRTPCQLQLPSAPSQPRLLPTLVKSHQTQPVFWRVRTQTLGGDSLPEAVSCCSVVPAVHPNGGERGALNAPICNRETCTVTTFRRQPPELRPSPPRQPPGSALVQDGFLGSAFLSCWATALTYSGTFTFLSAPHLPLVVRNPATEAVPHTPLGSYSPSRLSRPITPPVLPLLIGLVEEERK